MKKRSMPTANVAITTGGTFELNPKALERFVPLAMAEDGSEEENVIQIMEVIGHDFWTGGGVTAQGVAAQLRRAGGEDVRVVINSPGGSFFEGLAIYNLLNNYSGIVTVEVVGIAASAASVIAMAGDEIKIAKAAFYMIHNTQLVAGGDRHAFIDIADTMQTFDDASVDLYAARTGLAEADLSGMLDKETWLSGKRAVELGFADGHMDADLNLKQRSDLGVQNSLRMLDALLSQADCSRSRRRELLGDLKQGMQVAAQNDKPRAVEAAMNTLAALTQKL